MPFLPFFLPFFISSISSSAFLCHFFIPSFAADDVACLHMDLAVDRGGNVLRLEPGQVLVALEWVLAMVMGLESVLMSMWGWLQLDTLMRNQMHDLHLSAGYLVYYVGLIYKVSWCSGYYVLHRVCRRMRV